MRRIRQAKYLQLGKKFKSVQNWQPQNAHKHRQQSFLHKNCVSSGRFRKFCPISEEGSLCFNFVFCVYPLPPNTNIVHIAHQCFWSIIKFITIIQVFTMFSLRMINSSKISASGFFIVNRQDFYMCQFDKTWSCQLHALRNHFCGPKTPPPNLRLCYLCMTPMEKINQTWSCQQQRYDLFLSGTLLPHSWRQLSLTGSFWFSLPKNKDCIPTNSCFVAPFPSPWSSLLFVCVAA